MLLHVKILVKTAFAILFVLGLTVLSTGCPILVPIER